MELQEIKNKIISIEESHADFPEMWETVKNELKRRYHGGLIETARRAGVARSELYTEWGEPTPNKLKIMAEALKILEI